MSAAAAISIVGPGRLGTVLAKAFSGAGMSVSAVGARSFAQAARLAADVGAVPSTITDVLAEWAAPPSAVAGARPGGRRSEPLVRSTGQTTPLVRCVFLTVPDDAIAGVAAQIPWTAQSVAVHCSGAADLSVLDAASKRGAAVASFHPLQTFASPDAAASLPGSTVAIEADVATGAVLEGMAQAIGCTPFGLPAGSRATYHAAAVMASNYLVTLAAQAAGLWQTFGVDRARALDALIPLLQGTLQNLARVGLPAALTGPISRGDVHTIQRHLAALDASADAAGVYRELGLATVPIALEAGTIEAQQVAAIRALLTQSHLTTKEHRRANQHPAPA